MKNLEKYTNIFMEIFDVTEEKTKNLMYMEISEWDSVGHMALITTIEEAFEIMMDTDDIIEFTSFEVGKKILKKYGILI